MEIEAETASAHTRSRRSVRSEVVEVITRGERRRAWPVNHKRTYRLYAEEGLSIRTKLPRRKRAWRYRQGRSGAAAPNEIWAMDFMSDGLFDGRPIRILTIVDIHTREGLSTYPRANFRAAQVVEILDGLVRLRGKPKSLRVDNGPEFAGRLLDHWAYRKRGDEAPGAWA